MPGCHAAPGRRNNTHHFWDGSSFLISNLQVMAWIKGGPLLVINGAIIRYKWPCKWVTEVISPYFLVIGDISPHFIIGSGVHLVATFNVVNCFVVSLSPSKLPRNSSRRTYSFRAGRIVDEAFFGRRVALMDFCNVFFFFLRGVAETLWWTDKVLSWRFWDLFDVYKRRHNGS